MHTSFVTGPNQYAEPKALRVSLPSMVGPPTFGSLQGILPSLQGHQHVRPEPIDCSHWRQIQCGEASFQNPSLAVQETRAAVVV